MKDRLAVLLALLAIFAAVAAFVIMDRKMFRMKLRVAALERKQAPAPAPQEPAQSQEKPAVRKEMDPDLVRRMSLQDCQQRLDVIAQELKLEASVEMKLRDAFADEFSFYADSVVRAFEELQSRTSQSNLMSSPEFQKKLEEHILATDQKVAQILTVSQRWSFERWRTGLRKDFYGLE